MVLRGGPAGIAGDVWYREGRTLGRWELEEKQAQSIDFHCVSLEA